MAEKPIPTGAEMLETLSTAKEQVKEILETYPQAKGDDNLLLWKFYGRYSNIRISFKMFEQLRMAMRAETITRARRMLQMEQRDRVESIIRQQNPAFTDEDIKIALNEALKGSLVEYGEEKNIQPTERVRRKRNKREAAYKNALGEGTTLNDYTGD
jgi:hypothetical protein